MLGLEVPVTKEPKLLPLSKNWTEEMEALLEVAVAETETVPPIVELAVGEVIFTVGAITLG